MGVAQRGRGSARTWLWLWLSEDAAVGVAQ